VFASGRMTGRPDVAVIKVDEFNIKGRGADFNFSSNGDLLPASDISDVERLFVLLNKLFSEIAGLLGGGVVNRGFGEDDLLPCGEAKYSGRGGGE
jgi:hypothetical protein